MRPIYDGTNMAEKPLSRPQRERFIEAARSLGADEDEAAFKAKLAQIARHKPKDAPEPPKGEHE